MSRSAPNGKVHGRPATDRRARRTGVALVLAAAVLAGCSQSESLVDGLLGESKAPLTGKREAILSDTIVADKNAIATDPIAIPLAKTNANWTQPGGVPSHSMHNLTLSRELKRVWEIEAGIGSDSDGRLTASPIVVGSRIFVLDSQATVRAFSTLNGGAQWRRSLVPEGKDGEGAFGGGLASDGARVYATTAFGEVSGP